MDIKSLSTPGQLERNSFLWSEVRLVVAAVALFLGGIPPVLMILNGALVVLLLKLAWIVSGVASAYLLWRWLNSNMNVFGGKDRRDIAAFLVSVVSGINLGLTGLLGNNIGMSIASGKVIFIVVGVVYLIAALRLYRRWKAHGERVF